MDRPRQTLIDRFKLADFRPGQREVIDRLLAGKNVAAVFPTGGGKSLCYQLPSLMLDGLTLVISPLMALMREQVETLHRLDLPAARLDSSQSPEEVRATMQGLRSGETKILYVAPERFFNERFREMIAGLPISLFAVDEAHCISQWGHNFRPDYLKLASIAKNLRADRILALTATATPSVLEDICTGFQIAAEDAVRTPFHRRNLTLQFSGTDHRSRLSLFIDRLNSRPAGSTIVYVTLQKTSEELAEKLQASGFDVRAYHAGMEDEARRRIQDWFMTTSNAVVVATIAFGMGIDKADIRYVYHWNMSKGLESYAQEIGRAGRDGLPSICESMVVESDRIVLENFAYGDTPTPPSVFELVKCIAHQPELFHVSYFSLSNEFDIRDLVVRTLMTYLELEGFIEATAPRYDKYEFKPLVASAEILKHLQGDERRFASGVLSLSVKKKTWCELPIQIIAERLQCDRTRIVKLIDWIGEQGWMELKVSGLVHGYRRLKPIDDVEAVADRLFLKLAQLESQEIARIERLFETAISRTCQAALLANYFGQSIDQPCGQCSACTEAVVDRSATKDEAKIGSSALSQLRDLQKSHPDILSDPRSRARFLCGLSSPKLSRAKLTRHPLFGCCDEVPFRRVLEAVG
jgi:ATP-dependent DNA helicase RecQ